jgi:hypothetical protein
MNDNSDYRKYHLSWMKEHQVREMKISNTKIRRKYMALIGFTAIFLAVVFLLVWQQF